MGAPSRREDTVGAPADLVREKIRAFTTHDPGEPRALLGPDGEQRVSESIVPRGFDETAASHRGYWDAFPDFTWD
jgi:hypothetical protein